MLLHVLALNSGSSSMKYGLYRVETKQVTTLLSGEVEIHSESIIYQLGSNMPDRVVVAHLGNGASVTAVRAGHSIDTSMGLTPAGGVVMGTRSGDLDPGVLVYLMREKSFDATKMEVLINRHSGLAGISVIGSDMRRLHQDADTNVFATYTVFQLGLKWLWPATLTSVSHGDGDSPCALPACLTLSSMPQINRGSGNVSLPQPRTTGRVPGGWLRCRHRSRHSRFPRWCSGIAPQC